MRKHTRVQIQVKWFQNGKKVGRVVAHTISRIQHRCPGGGNGRFNYLARVRYSTEKQELSTGEKTFIDNEFVAATKTELMDKLRIFAGSEEVGFAKRYWGIK
jgi:hypothetical protein